ncbi:MAG: glycosyltransferase family 4 protein [Planctomycetes bacterium]|nr:glycosyltransferase family 4 protein [Planctomycetota bacterium]MCP4771936.1 glycosyltransferase family 4 protein [Planctomycetota bacterium]MCP4860413.1 glycosyltransferase family 4 protein [Planctomycetota bacterium]
MSDRLTVALDVRCLDQPFSSYARVIRLIRLAAQAVDLELKEWREGACGANVLWTPDPTVPKASDNPRLLLTVQDLNPMLPDGRSAFARWRRTRRYRKLIESIDQAAWRICVPSTATADSMAQHFPHLQTAKVQIPWFPSSEFHAGEHAPIQGDVPDPGYLLYVGALRQHKNWPLVLKVYARLPQHLREQHPLVILGSGHRSGKQAFTLATELGIADEVLWLQGLANADLPALYAGASVFLFPSLLEGFGLPPLEAQACGTPVIAAATSSLPEVLADSAQLLPPHDVNAWVAATVALLENPQQRSQAREAGLSNVQRYGPEVTGQALLEVLEQLEN